ncbi:MAG TPA: MazG-like family protein [Candidatus Saccharibacteria bacterium]|nr:MazG-like family protein [Candidatus Saccharibacteria bacterium]
MTFEQFKTNVEAWQEERGIYAHSTPLAQALKAVSEVGELADSVIKGDRDALKDAIGDVMACLVGVCKMSSFCIEFMNPGAAEAHFSQHQVASIIAGCVTDICAIASNGEHPSMLIDPACDAMYWMDTLAMRSGLTLLECCESAWNEIKDRTGKMVAGGAFVKDGDV